MKTLHQIYESFRFAWKALKANIMRTVLSLLSVTVGIFLVIAVLTFVDSLEKNIKDSFNFIGSGTIYVQKWPWVPENDGQFRWWDYWMRPTPSVNEFKFLSQTLKHKSHIAIFADRGDLTFKRGNNSIGQVELVGGSEGYDQIFTIDVEKGRYFTGDEISSGRNVVVLGFEVAKALFPNDENPLGQAVKVKNLKYTVIGVIKREGEAFIGGNSKDFSAIIPYNAFRRMYQTGTGRWNELQSTIGIKGFDTDIGLVELENEMRGLLRVRRGLRPAVKDNFAFNRPEAIMSIIGNLFDGVSMAGWFIGGFAMLVGGFGIANIMFVSVKERTPIIGLQKSLGAKNYFILFQFLFEAIFLSMIGGLTGLFLVYLLTFVPVGSMVIVLSIKNIVLGLGVSTVIGVVCGIVPAAMAARLDPVTAIRA